MEQKQCDECYLCMSMNANEEMLAGDAELVILMLILMLLNLNKDYADTDL